MTTVISLTTGADTIVTSDPAGTEVNATSVTLNSGDSLTGGAGTDVLMLQGGGWFRLDQLAHFSGFEQIKVDNVTSTAAELFLAGDQPITVSSSGSGRVEVQLSNGATTINGGQSNYVVVRSSNSTNWNAGDVFDDVDYLTLNLDSASNQTYDLTTNSFTNVARLDGLGSYLTLKINSAVAAGIASFYSNNDQIGQLVTSDASLDLSHTHVSGFKITSTNASGTTFDGQRYRHSLSRGGRTGR